MSSNSSNLGRVAASVGVLVWAFLGFAAAQLIGLLVVSLLDAWGVPLDAYGETFYTTVSTLGVYTLALLIVIGIPRKIKKASITLIELGLQRGPKFIDFLWPFGGAIMYVILASIITVGAMYLFPSADYDQAQNTGFSVLSTRWEYVLAFISLVIIAPVAEEILFRGYLLGKLLKHAPVWIAVVLSAGLFAVAHGQFNLALDTFALGLVLGMLRIYSGSIWPSIFLHMLKNGVAFYFLFISPLLV